MLPILENSIKEQTVDNLEKKKKKVYVKLIQRFVLQSRKGHANDSNSSTLQPVDMDWGESSPSNHGL